MKKFSFIKIVLLATTFVASTILVTSCNEKYDSQDTREVAEDRNKERFDNDDREDDAKFLVNAAEMNLEEIRLGKLAQQKGTTSHVKELGKMMEDGHTRLQRDLASLAQSKGISIPSSPTHDSREAYDDLNEKQGRDFDEAYANRMVREHNNAIDTFEDAAEDSNDADIKRWAKSALSDLRSHRNHSIDCQKKFADAHMEDNNRR